MAPRQVVPLLYGAGMDRATGVHSVEGRAGRDLRNVYLYRDKAQVRHGHTRVNSLVLSGGVTITDVLMVQAMLAEQIGLVAGFGSDGEVYLFRVSGDGSGLSVIGPLDDGTGHPFVVSSGAHRPPRILAAEQFSKIFVAHDEAVRSFRAPTQYYNPYGVPSLTTPVFDLDGDPATTGPLLFRGVAAYLTYMVGWGYGTETDPDEAHVVRVSHPDDPTLWDADDYFEAGTGGSPVLTCQPAGTPDNSCLMVLKPKELHQIFGYDKLSFGIRQIESRGVASSRLAYSLGGVVYFWESDEGPRRTSGGPSEDLAWPLDLNAPAPADLAAEGALEDGFACYLPSQRCILFVFGKRVYVLSLWDPNAIKWSYSELPFAAQCGGNLFQGGEVPTTPPTAEAGNVVLSVIDDTGIYVAWDNGVVHPLTGGEIVELWMHAKTADTWTLVDEMAASGASQTDHLTTILAGKAQVDPGLNYELQIRYRRGPYYRADYAATDPASWPSGSLSNTAQTWILPPVLTSATWSRVSATVEQVALAWTGSLVTDSIVYRNAVAIATVPAGTMTYDDVGVTGETSNVYTVTQKGDVESNPSNALTVWAGPNPTLSFDSFDICERLYNAYWTTDDSIDPVQIDLQDFTQGPTWYQAIRTTSEPQTGQPVAAVNSGPIPNPVNYGDTINARIRIVQTAFGVDDYSPAVANPTPPAVLFNNTACV